MVFEGAFPQTRGSDPIGDAAGRRLPPPGIIFTLSGDDDAASSYMSGENDAVNVEQRTAGQCTVPCLGWVRYSIGTAERHARGRAMKWRAQRVLDPSASVCSINMAEPRFGPD